MKPSAFKNILLLSPLFIVLLACARKKGETIPVSIRIQADKAFTQSTSTSEPTNLNEINCYYVLVGGPEDYMNTMACGQKMANGDLSNAISAGLLVGGIEKGQNSVIQMDVPVGDNRHFYLFGTKSVPPLGCRQYGVSFYSLNIKTVTSSNAYLIGSVLNRSLGSGNTQEIAIPTTLEPQNWVDQCLKYGVTNGEISGDTDAAAAVLYVDKQTFPTSNRFRANACEPFHVTPKNIFWKNKPLTSDSVVQTKRLLEAGGNEPIETYSSAADCVDSMSGSSSFSVLAGVETTTRWMKIDPTVETAYKLQMVPDTASLVPAFFSSSQNAYWSIYPRSSSNKTFSLLGSELIQKDVCYAYKVSLHDLGGAQYSLSTAPYSFSNYSAGSAQRNYSVYSDSGCTNDITTQSHLTLETIYVKFPYGPGAGRSNLVVQNGTTIGFLTMYALGNSNPTSTSIVGARTLALGRCEGPFMVHLKNSDGAHLINSSANSVALLINSSSPVLHATATCTDTAASSMSRSIGSGKSGAYFYIKSSTPSTSATLNMTSTGLSPSTFEYSVQSF